MSKQPGSITTAAVHFVWSRKSELTGSVGQCSYLGRFSRPEEHHFLRLFERCVCHVPALFLMKLDRILASCKISDRFLKMLSL